VLQTETVYTVDEVAAHFKVSRTTVERAIRTGRLRAYIFGEKSLRRPGRRGALLLRHGALRDVHASTIADDCGLVTLMR